MSLHLGSLYTVVASSPEVAKKVLQQHDQALCSRTVIAAAEAHDFHKSLPLRSRAAPSPSPSRPCSAGCSHLKAATSRVTASPHLLHRCHQASPVPFPMGYSTLSKP
ncbi:hypothetical protein ACS0TY_021283 [Phlomoides rotata]